MMNNQEENKWYAIHRPEDPKGDAQIAKNMAYAAETGALKPQPQPQPADEYGIVPQMLPFEGTTFDDTPPPGLDETPIAETAVFENEPGKPSGSFTYGGVNYVLIKGKWTALKPDGAPMNPGEMFQHTSSMHQNKKPGHVTGQPLLPSRLFEKPTVAQR